MRFYLSRGDVNSPDYATKSEFASFEENWTIGLAKLAERHAPSGPVAGSLEINCHGERGKLKLKPLVTFDNLELFAQGIARLLKPGGQIEILACLVAQLPFSAKRWRDLFPELALLPGMRGKVMRTAARGEGLDPTATASKRTAPPASPDEVTAAFQYLIDKGTPYIEWQHVTERIKADGSSYKTQTQQRAENGPLFCSRLATLTGLTVRAADVPQEEEGGGFSPIREEGWSSGYMFGNWEGHVLDFKPDGSVKYLGENVKRVGVNRDGQPYSHWVAA